jgi:hypothetical protein
MEDTRDPGIHGQACSGQGELLAKITTSMPSRLLAERIACLDTSAETLQTRTHHRYVMPGVCSYVKPLHQNVIAAHVDAKVALVAVRTSFSSCNSGQIRQNGALEDHKMCSCRLDTTDCTAFYIAHSASPVASMVKFVIVMKLDLAVTNPESASVVRISATK